MTAWLALCRVSHRLPAWEGLLGQAGPAHAWVEGAAWHDRGCACLPGPRAFLSVTTGER